MMSEIEKRMILGMAVQVGIITMMNTHLYSFDGNIYLQKSGGPIGLRATCAVARITMSMWDKRWMNMMEKEGITIITGIRYMDDIRIFLPAIRKGWRWREGRVVFSKVWEREDRNSTRSDTCEGIRSSPRPFVG